jgi:WD40 repeat protein
MMQGKQDAEKPPMSDELSYDVFLSHSSLDKSAVRSVAERLRADGFQVWFDSWEILPGDSIPARIEEGLEHSRVLLLFMSKHAFGSDWAQLEAGTFRFRDPLNKTRRLIPVRLDDTPVKGSLAQFRYIDWRQGHSDTAYSELLRACVLARQFAAVPSFEPRDTLVSRSGSRPPNFASPERSADNIETKDAGLSADGRPSILEGHEGDVYCLAISQDGSLVVSGSHDNSIRIWDARRGECQRIIQTADSVREVVIGHGGRVYSASSDGTIGVWDLSTGRSIAVLKGHSQEVFALALARDSNLLVSGSRDGTMRLWNTDGATSEGILAYGNPWVNSVVLLPDDNTLIAGTEDGNITVWDIKQLKRTATIGRHASWVWGLALASDGKRLVSGSGDSTVGVWDIHARRRTALLEGHTDKVSKIAISSDGQWAVSGSLDKTAKIWNLNTGAEMRTLAGHSASVECVAISADQRMIVTGSKDRRILVWTVNPSHFRAISKGQEPLEQVQYTNAKVLLVGDTSSGKTGLAHRLATGDWKSSDGSTIGSWSTQWKLPQVGGSLGLEREVWLWDFGGQADQRLVHQLYMDRAALVLLLFDADRDDVMPTLRDWQAALRRSVPPETPRFLVAGRTDAGFRASRPILKQFAVENSFRYFETSALDGHGCPELVQGILDTIPWSSVERRVSPRVFKQVKDAILELRDAGQVLHTFKELRDLLWQRVSTDTDRFSEEILRTVIGLLDGPGAVKELDYGTYVLLQPEWINVYAQAVIRTLRQEPSGLGYLPLRSIADARLSFQTVRHDGGVENVKRLPEPEEKVVLREMERQLEDRGLCLRQGDKLVFPSHCGRDRPLSHHQPTVFVSYAVEGYLDDIYATLVVKLADSEAFTLVELWRDAADFMTLVGSHHMGITLTRDAAAKGTIGVYFAPGVTKQEQVIFATYLHSHLDAKSDRVLRLRHYVCPYCHTAKGNPEVLMQKLLAQKELATVECDKCERRFELWDDLEKKFASATVREQVEGLKSKDAFRIDARRKGKLLALEVSARITSADQKCSEIPATEDEGLDMEVEFTDDSGRGTGRRVYLQLKSGNSYLRRRKRDGAEMFRIEQQRWVEYWLKQPCPVMLVIGTFKESETAELGKDKLEFENVRWMEITSALKHETQGGSKRVGQIEFKGERLDLSSIQRLRRKALESLVSARD